MKTIIIRDQWSWNDIMILALWMKCSQLTQTLKNFPIRNTDLAKDQWSCSVP